MPNFSSLKLTLLAGAFGCALAFSSLASAQDYGPGPNDDSYQNGPSEDVTVTAPRFKEQPGRGIGSLEKVSLSSGVPYNDLDLRTHRGARELRHRVRETARDVCQQLAEAYPFYQANGTSCYRDAVMSGMRHADAAIQDARDTRYDY